MVFRSNEVQSREIWQMIYTSQASSDDEALNSRQGTPRNAIRHDIKSPPPSHEAFGVDGLTFAPLARYQTSPPHLISRSHAAVGPSTAGRTSR